MTNSSRLLSILFYVLFAFNLDAKDYKKLMSELDRTEYEAGKLQEKIDSLDILIKTQAEAFKILESDLNNKQAKVISKEKELKENLRVLMSFSIPERIGFITAGKDFEDLIRSEAIVSKMLKKDVNTYDKLSKDISEVMTIKELVDEEKKKLEQKRAEQFSVLGELKKKLTQKKILLNRAKKNAASYLAFIQRTDKSSQRIENLTAKTKLGQNLNSGDLNNIPPLRGRIVNSFGKVWDAKLRNWIYNKGVTVQTSYASNVSAINDGVVIYTGWIPVYGRVLIIDHQNGLFSIYGHLSKIFFEVGDKVKKGSIIAHSGDSGSVDSPALYFGLRDTTNDIDPTPLFY